MPPFATARMTSGTRWTGQASMLKIMWRLDKSGATAAANKAMIRRSVEAFTHALFRLRRKTLPVCDT